MTITYPNGNVLNAIVLAHEDHEVRAVAAGWNDVLVCTRIHDTWLSEDWEPVTLGFEWQRGGTTPAGSEDDCICPKELAARLISTLAGASERDEADMNTLYGFSPEGTRAANHRTGPANRLPAFVF
jgi:hypothetical protein